MFKNCNLMKKMIVLGACVCVFATGCQGVEKELQNGGNVTGLETQKPETQKPETPKPEASDKKAEVYYETKIDLGQKTASDIRLTAESDAVSGKKFYVDGEERDSISTPLDSTRHRSRWHKGNYCCILRRCRRNISAILHDEKD